VWRSSAKAEARLLVEIHLGFAVLAGGTVLRHLLAAALAEGATLGRLFAGGWPVMMWTVFGVFGCCPHVVMGFGEERCSLAGEGRISYQDLTKLRPLPMIHPLV